GVTPVASRETLARHNSLPAVVRRTIPPPQSVGALGLPERLPAARKARWRERQRRGAIVVRVEVGAAALGLLIATHWLLPAGAGAPVAIGRAIGALLEDSAKQG